MSEAIQAFYQARDSVMLVQGNWLQYKGAKIDLLDKKEARNSMSRVGKLEHAFGYGTFGFHTLNDAVERVAAQFIHQFEESILKHLQYLQGDRINGLSPKTMEDIINLSDITDAMEKIEKIHQTKQELLRILRAKFFEHNTVLSKCCLLATIILRNFGWIFQRDKKTNSFYLILLAKQAFGYGPLGYDRLQGTIKNVAKQCIRALGDPVLASLKKIQSGKIHELPDVQIEAAIKAMEKIENIEQLKEEMLSTARHHFVAHSPRIGRWCLLAVSFFQSLRHRFKPEATPYLSSQAIEDVRLQSHQKSMDKYLLQLKPYQHPMLIWQGKKMEHLFELYLATSCCSQQLQLYKDNKRLGNVVFCRDSKDRQTILSVTNYDFEEKEAESFFYPLLQKMAQAARVSEIKWSLKALEAPSQAPSYDRIELKPAPELESLQKLLDAAEKEAVFTGLIPLNSILQSFA